MQEYMRSLQKQLRRFPPAERAALIEEITSHIESAETDPALADSPEQRRRKLMAELGSPKELEKGFRAIYRPDRWIDFLLIAVPLLIIIPYFNTLLLNYYYVYVARVDILVGLLLVAIGLWRQSSLLTLFWITARATQIAAVLWVANGYYGQAQTILYSLIGFGLLLLWGRIVWQNRHDVLTVTFGLLPLVLCPVGLAIAAIRPGPLSWHYGPLNGLLWNIYTAGSDPWGGYIPFLGPILAMALFFLATNRNLRWLGLGVWGLVVGLGREYLNLVRDFHDAQGSMDPSVYVLWVIFPLVIVLCGWWLDHSRTLQFIAAG
jgi:hypothetical protein